MAKGTPKVRGSTKLLQDEEFGGGLSLFLYISDTILGRLEFLLENKPKQPPEMPRSYPNKILFFLQNLDEIHTFPWKGFISAQFNFPNEKERKQD